MAKVCKHCGKTVYHAEEQLSDGMVFHMGCFTLYKKERDAAELARRNAAYVIPADVQPAYYRTGDSDSAKPRMESGAEYKGNVSPRSANAVATASGKACLKCGHMNSQNAKFCGECGTKF